MSNTRSAFAAIVGRPNVGKSSLLNRILGQKVAIVSNKPQTTRNKIMGIHTDGATQIVFIDTPGLHKARTKLGNFMVKTISDAVSGVDVCILVTEPYGEISESELKLIDDFKNSKIPAVLVINKIDIVKDKSDLINRIEEFTKLYEFDSVIPLSARTGDGVNLLLKEIDKYAFDGPHFFDDEQFTDQPERVIAGELVREKMLRYLDKEIPHGTGVDIEKFSQRDNGILDIVATIYCEKDSHKGIIIGKGGAMLKKIGSSARADMERFFDCKVNLQCWIKVKDDWRNKQGMLRALGYDENK